MQCVTELQADRPETGRDSVPGSLGLEQLPDAPNIRKVSARVNARKAAALKLGTNRRGAGGNQQFVVAESLSRMSQNPMAA